MGETNTDSGKVVTLLIQILKLSADITLSTLQ